MSEDQLAAIRAAREACASEPAGESDAAEGGRAPVTGELLGQVQAVLRRYVVLPGDAEADALSLYALHTWSIASAAATPYLLVVSPEKQAGKSRLLEVLALVVREPWHTASATEAAIFRKIERDLPTLLLDELDALFGANGERTEAIRGILNAGNRRGAVATRVVGQGPKMEVRDFSCFCPKVLAGIATGRLPETIKDRSVLIEMKRRRAGETVQRLRLKHAERDLQPLRVALETWAAASHEHLLAAEPNLPSDLDDRAADAWEPILSIADLAGGDWPARARAAAIELSAGEDDDVGRGAQLLGAIRHAMGAEPTIATVDLLLAINSDEDLPFGGYSEGKGLDGRGLARLLKPYGVKRTTFRIGETTHKGYKAVDLADPWARYLLPAKGGNSGNSVTTASLSPVNPRWQADVTPVTDVTPVAGVGAAEMATLEDAARTYAKEQADQNGDGPLVDAALARHNGAPS